MDALKITVPLLDGTIYEASLTGIGPKSQQLLSHIIQLNYLRMGFIDARAVYPIYQFEVWDVMGFAFGAQCEGLNERDVRDWISMIMPKAWATINLYRHDPISNDIYVHELVNSGDPVFQKIDSRPSCFSLGVTGTKFFRELIKSARDEFALSARLSGSA
jgi:hypothetical protein